MRYHELFKFDVQHTVKYVLVKNVLAILILRGIANYEATKTGASVNISKYQVQVWPECSILQNIIKFFSLKLLKIFYFLPATYAPGCSSD